MGDDPIQKLWTACLYDWRKAEIIYILLKQFFRLDVQFWSSGAEEVPWLEWLDFSLTWHWTSSLVEHQHTLRNKTSRGMAGSIIWSSLWKIMHVTCQRRHSRNVLTKALRNIHCHCSTASRNLEFYTWGTACRKQSILIKIWRNLNNFTLCWLHVCWLQISSSSSADPTWQHQFSKTWSADLKTTSLFFKSFCHRRNCFFNTSIYKERLGI